MVEIDSGHDLPVGGRRHISMTVGGAGTATLFVDGTQVGQSAGAPPCVASDDTVAVDGHTAIGDDTRSLAGSECRKTSRTHGAGRLTDA